MMIKRPKLRWQARKQDSPWTPLRRHQEGTPPQWAARSCNSGSWWLRRGRRRLVATEGGPAPTVRGRRWRARWEHATASGCNRSWCWFPEKRTWEDRGPREWRPVKSQGTTSACEDSTHVGGNIPWPAEGEGDLWTFSFVHQEAKRYITAVSINSFNSRQALAICLLRTCVFWQASSSGFGQTEYIAVYPSRCAPKEASILLALVRVSEDRRIPSSADISNKCCTLMREPHQKSDCTSQTCACRNT